ncbi:S8 family serine peptidase [Paenibacillus sp. UMB4589-SE434]|uniref:S8 family serine peptidase n=1 Tax=Paenibacillus sp. UMB4589-SE434 TaxID=3046314 RepID=UPI00254B40AD|nr:S8 family serine peptidase [Paenibacillus sp. UMB4589-SE434]MDK8181892.1 S8 family serine peptidase [Paenibacillus sp. UMB4589-SE434]
MKNKPIWKKTLLSLSATLLAASLFLQQFALAAPSSTSGSLSIPLDLANRLDTLALSGQPSVYVSPKLNTGSDKPVRVIVQLSGQPVSVGKYAAAEGVKNLAAESTEAAINHQQQSLVATAKTNGIDLKVNYTYNTVLNGMEITIPASQIPALAKLPGIKSIHENRTYYSIPVQEPLNFDINNPKFEILPLKHIGADVAWSQGLTGKKLKVGVIDTGVDYLHPDLAAAYKGGYDSIDNDNDPYEGIPISPQDDPKHIGYSGSYHGTHVAGTIVGRAANKTSDIVQRGVAYDADLYAYRVLGRNAETGRDSGSSAQVIDGIERAVKDGVDVINLSLGADVDKDPLSPDSIAINNAVLGGVVAIISNGNAGDKGPYYYSVGSPATSQLAISVGATTVDSVFYNTTVTESVYGQTLPLNIMSWTTGQENFNQILGTQPIEAVYAGLGHTSDYANINANGKVVFVSRGNYSFVEKIETAKKFGAKAIIIFNGINTGSSPNLSPSIPGRDDFSNVYVGDAFNYIPTFDMQGAAGRALAVNILSNPGKPFTFTFGAFNKSIIPGDQVTSFSSRGPNADGQLGIKPDVAAPGNNILSTIPAYAKAIPNASYNQAYGRLSGTSMAAPHVAGATLLLKQLHPEWTPFDIRAALANTADGISDEKGTRYDVYSQGAGRISVSQAVYTPAVLQTVENITILDKNLNPVSVTNYGDNASFGVMQAGEAAKTIALQLKNTSLSAVQYQASVQLHPQVTSDPNASIPTPDVNQIDVKLVGLGNGDTVTANANSVQPFSIQLAPKATAVAGVYEGEIVLKHATLPTLHLPFVVHVNKGTPNGFGLYDLSLSNKIIQPYGVDSTSTTKVNVTLGAKTKLIILNAYGINDELIGELGAYGTLDSKGQLNIIQPQLFTFTGIDGSYTDGQKDANGNLIVKYLKEGTYKLEVLAPKLDANNAYVYNETGQQQFHSAYTAFAVRSYTNQQVQGTVDKALQQFKATIINTTTTNRPVLGFPQTPRIKYAVTKSSHTSYINSQGVLKALPSSGSVTVDLTVAIFSDELASYKKEAIVRVILTSQGTGSSGGYYGGGGTTTTDNNINSSTPSVAAVINQGQVSQVVKSTTKTEGTVVTGTISDFDLKAALEKAPKSPTAVIISVTADTYKQQTRVVLTPAQIKQLVETQIGSTVVVSNGTQSIALPVEVLKGLDKDASVSIEISSAADKQAKLKEMFPEAQFVGMPTAFAVNVLKGTTSTPIVISAKHFIKRAFIVPGSLDTTGALFLKNDTGAPIPALVTKNSDNTTIVTINHPGLGTYVAASRTVNFNDITQSWAKSRIESLAAKFIVNGSTATTFSPKKDVTRAEFAAMLVRALGIESQADAPFKDVKATAWYAEDVAAAYEIGLINGVNKSTFNPNASISRQDLAVILARAAALLQVPKSNPSKQAYGDAKVISGYATNSIKDVTDSGLMKGEDKGGVSYFRPEAPTTREAAVSVLFALLQQGKFIN